MELTELKDRICSLYRGPIERLEQILNLIGEGDAPLYPFNEYEHLLMYLLNEAGINFEDYLSVRAEYISQNPHMWLFEISSPRHFGEKFAQTYVQAKSRFLQKPDKKIDPTFKGEYDLILDNRIKIEVKASRATDADSCEPLYMKALARMTSKRFWMNFQQLKPQCCDVFIWLAVFRDEIVVWIFGSNDVLGLPFYSKGQHRGNTGNEGQLHITNENINFFEKYELKGDNILDMIRKAAQNSACSTPL